MRKGNPKRIVITLLILYGRLYLSSIKGSPPIWNIDLPPFLPFYSRKVTAVVVTTTDSRPVNRRWTKTTSNSTKFLPFPRKSPQIFIKEENLQATKEEESKITTTTKFLLINSVGENCKERSHSFLLDLSKLRNKRERRWVKPDRTILSFCWSPFIDWA